MAEICSPMRDLRLDDDYNVVGAREEEICVARRTTREVRLEEEEKMKNVPPVPKFNFDTNPWFRPQGLPPYDLKRLLTTPYRNYLIDSQNRQVPIDCLLGKHVLLLFWLLKDGRAPYQFDSSFLEDLEQVYRCWYPRGHFQVVFVALGNNKTLFDASFSRMMWLAIPHEDLVARDYLSTIFPYDHSLLCPGESALLFDPLGTLVLRRVRIFFRKFGPEGFPFTKQVIDTLRIQHRTMWTELAIKKSSTWGKVPLTLLLGVDYLPSFQGGNSIPTAELENKIVGLHCFTPTPDGFRRTKQLLRIWDSLKSKGKAKEFEIVVFNHISISHSLALKKFLSEFGSSIPWYFLPFDGRHLFQMLRMDFCVTTTDHSLITIEPGRPQPLNYFAFRIFDVYGLRSYPFTLEKAVILEKKIQVKDNVLQELISPKVLLYRGYPNSRNQEETTLENLLGKRIILLFASSWDCGCRTLSTLQRMYNDQTRAGDDDFEIIYFSLDGKGPSASRALHMPWWVCFLDKTRFLICKLFNIHPGLIDTVLKLPALVAFGPNGHLESRESDLANRDSLNSKYPFVHDMEEEVRRELIKDYQWDVVERLNN